MKQINDYIENNPMDENEEFFFKKGIELAQQWISTKEELPEIKEKTYIALVKFHPTPFARGPYSILQIDKSMTIEEVMEYMRWCSHWIPIKLL